MAFACSSLNIEEIKKSNEQKFGQLFDFEKHKKQKEKLQILREFVNDVNNNKLFINMLTQMEMEFIVFANEHLKNKQDLNNFVEEKISLYNELLNTFDILIRGVKHFPKSQFKNRGKDLRLKEQELKLFDFLKNRFDEFKLSLKIESKNIPYYVEKALDSMHLEEIAPKKIKISIVQYIDTNEDLDEKYMEPEVFIGQIYLLYNAINPDFINENIIYFINNFLKIELKDKTAEEAEKIKEKIKFNKIQLRYSETLEKLA